jgi:hypothetical protein
MATTTLTVRDQALEVSTLPENIQQAVHFYDQAVERVQKAEADLVVASSAGKYLLNDITRLVDTYLEAEAAEPAEGEAAAEAEEPAAA